MTTWSRFADIGGVRVCRIDNYVECVVVWRHGNAFIGRVEPPVRLPMALVITEAEAARFWHTHKRVRIPLSVSYRGNIYAYCDRALSGVLEEQRHESS